MNEPNEPQYYNNNSYAQNPYGNNGYIQNSSNNSYAQNNYAANNDMSYNAMQQMPYNMMQQTPYNSVQPQLQTDVDGKRNIPSMVCGLISAVLLAICVFAPAIDFSAYHASVHFAYSLMKICQNVGLLSSMWMGIPYGILIAALLMCVLSFVDIPQLKLIPTAIVVIMIVLMLADIGNIVAWVMGMIEKFSDAPSMKDSTIGVVQVIKSFLPGIYCLAAGLVTGIVSCFVKGRKVA